MRRIAVVGASLAGLRTAEALRHEGHDGALTLIGQEPHPPYDRPPLSKALLHGTLDPAQLDLRRGAGMAELALDLRLGVRAERLDVRARRITLSDRSEVEYDGLVIATGASARTLALGRELERVHVLRTLDDALAIKEALKARPRVCVIGAGFIGLEVAASCRALGLEVTVVEPQRRPLIDRLGEIMAEHVYELHHAHGVLLRCDTSVTAVEGKHRVERLRLSDGSVLPADLVVVGIGVTPAVQWRCEVRSAAWDGQPHAVSAPSNAWAISCARPSSLRSHCWPQAVQRTRSRWIRAEQNPEPPRSCAGWERSSRLTCAWR